MTAEDLILQASVTIEGWCRRVFGREEVTETFRLSAERAVLHLARWPNVALASIVEELKTGGQIVGNAGTQVSAIADLAGTVGAANDTMTAVPVPTDTPADADALRDDIATNDVTRNAGDGGYAGRDEIT